MIFDRAVKFFLPAQMRSQPTHPRYHEFRVIVSSVLVALPVLMLFPVFVYWLHKPVAGFLINDVLIIILLLSIRLFGHYRIPMTITAVVTYFIIYDWISVSGLIYSPNISILHMYLLAAIWADKRYGWYAIFSNLTIFAYIYYRTLESGLTSPVGGLLGGPLYAFGMNCLITLFFGCFLAWQQYDQERDRIKIRDLQDQKITVLDRAVRERTEQLNTMRENIATDFHDETGNMLSAVTRQAALLKSKLKADHKLQPIVDSILTNIQGLYASSKDFLWHLNHNSDDPVELFDYLTAYGQRFYNQFDIAFSSEANDYPLMQLAPSAALNIIFIFKEAMTNAFKHAGGTNVQLSMHCEGENIVYALQDNGSWKMPESGSEHYGLENMERRSARNNFKFELEHLTEGTLIRVTVLASYPEQL